MAAQSHARSAVATKRLTKRATITSWWGLLGHGRELRTGGPDVGYLMRDDQMMRGVHGDLDVIAHDT